MAIVILTWNDYQNTHKCLLSIRDITYKNFFVVVVDNGSVDGSGEKLKVNSPNTTMFLMRKIWGSQKETIKEFVKY